MTNCGLDEWGRALPLSSSMNKMPSERPDQGYFIYVLSMFSWLINVLSGRSLASLWFVLSGNEGPIINKYPTKWLFVELNNHSYEQGLCWRWDEALLVESCARRLNGDLTFELTRLVLIWQEFIWSTDFSSLTWMVVEFDSYLSLLDLPFIV